MSIQKILFFKPGAIGDFLHTLPALKALQNKFPAAVITVVVSPGQESLIQGTPVAGNVLVYNKDEVKKSVKALWKFGLRLRQEHYDLFVDMQPSFKSRVLRRLSGAHTVLVYRKQKKIKHGERRLHAADNFMETIRQLGIEEIAATITLPLQPDAVAAIDTLLSRVKIPQEKPLTALNCSVGAARPARNWFPDRFAALADRLVTELNAAVVFIGGKEDSELVASVLSLMKQKAVSVAGKLSISESAALLARCRCLVSSDTGPLHLATAVGTPVVGLYGSTDPQRTGPIGRGHQVILKKLPCVPCEQKDCPLTTRICMSEITVDEVASAVKDVLQCA